MKVCHTQTRVEIKKEQDRQERAEAKQTPEHYSTTFGGILFFIPTSFLYQ